MFFVPRVSSYSRAKVSCGWSRILAVFILFLWHASAQGRVGPRDDFVRAPFGTIRLIARDPELSFGGAIFQSKSELRPNLSLVRHGPGRLYIQASSTGKKTTAPRCLAHARDYRPLARQDKF